MTTELSIDQRREQVAAANGRPAPARPLVGGVRVLTPPRPSSAPPAAPAALEASAEQLLDMAETSRHQRTRTLGARVRELHRELRTRLHAEVAEREAEARVAALRAELAEAEGQLRQARRPGVPAPSTGTASPAAGVDPDVNRAVRAWAAANGVEVNQRGNVRRDVLAQWRAATGQAAS